MEYHKPVLLDEVIDNIITDKDAIYVDCTLGGGGHTEGILENSSENSKVIAIDQDIQAIEFAKKRLEKYENKLQIFQDNFRNIDTAVYLAGFEKVDRILMDIGVSSNQLDNAKRGFSYRFAARLDMRMDSNLKISAYEVVNNFSEKEIADIIYKYGEEPKSRKIAKKIIEYRKNKPIETTTELADIVIKSIGKSMKRHPAKRTFQAIRIFVNKELEVLSETLDKAIKLLNKNGRLLVITFHSLEDRIVKEKFREYEDPCTCPKDIPICVCNKKSLGKIITKKPIIAKKLELEKNNGAHSAKLRIFERSEKTVMNGVSKNKKMQMEILDVPKITNTARSHEDARRERIVAPKEVRKQLSRTAGLNMKVIGIVSIYVAIVTMVALLRVFVSFDISELGKKMDIKEKQLIELKKEVARLDTQTVDNEDLKTKEIRAKEKGFDVPNAPIYINLNN